MRELNIDFMDLYKSVDRFIRDAYGSEEGVSEYIRQMEQNDYKGVKYVSNWKTDYADLKHLRWIRNQLSHEVGYDSDICEESDYDRLESFSDRLYSACDPISAMNKAEKDEQERKRAEQRRLQQNRAWEQQRVAAMQMSSQQQYRQQYQPQNQPRYHPEKKKSFWQRIKEFFSS